MTGLMRMQEHRLHFIKVNHVVIMVTGVQLVFIIPNL